MLYTVKNYVAVPLGRHCFVLPLNRRWRCVDRGDRKEDSETDSEPPCSLLLPEVDCRDCQSKTEEGMSRSMRDRKAVYLYCLSLDGRSLRCSDERIVEVAMVVQRSGCVEAKLWMFGKCKSFRQRDRKSCASACQR